MSRKHLVSWTVCLVSLFLFNSTTEASNPLKFNVTSDNAYRFGLGDQTGISPGPNVYWFNDVWNSTSGQIHNAESYPNSTPPFKTLSYDYFYIACYGGYENTRDNFTYADVVVVMDESHSMGATQLFTVKLIHTLDKVLIQNNIGAGNQINAMNQYGLVGFGGPPIGHAENTDPTPQRDHVLGHMHGGILNPYDYGDAVYKLAYKLQAGGGGNSGGEDGYSGIMCALHDYPWRQDAKKIILFLTNENRDKETNFNYNDVLNALIKAEVTLNTVVYCDITSKKVKSFANPGGPPTFQKGMAINYNGTVFTSGGLGVPYTTSPGTINPGGSIKDAADSWGQTLEPGALGTVSEYANLAFDTGGLAGDIRIIASYGTTSYAKAQGNSFAAIISSQIAAQASLQKNPYRGVIAEVVDANSNAQYPFYSQAKKWEVYATGTHGNSNGIWSSTNPPTINEINQHIANANNVTGTPGDTSQGWVNHLGQVFNGAGILQIGYTNCGELVTGEQNNSNADYFKIVSPMNKKTRWMWYNPDPVNVTTPFEYGLASNGQNDGSREFLIFRLKVRDLVPTRRSPNPPRTSPSRGDLIRFNPPRSNSPRPKPPRTKPPRTERPKTNLPRDERPFGRPQGRPTGRPLNDPKRTITEPDRIKPSNTGRPTSGPPLNGPAVDRPRGVNRKAVSQPTPPTEPTQGKKRRGDPDDNGSVEITDFNRSATDKKRLPTKLDKKKQSAGKEARPRSS